MKVIKRRIRCPLCVSYQNTDGGQSWIYKAHNDPTELNRVEMLLKGLGIEVVEY